MGLHRKGCDCLFSSLSAPAAMTVLSNLKGCCGCIQPLHMWILVHCSTMFVSWLLMLLDKAIAARMSWEQVLNTQQRLTCFCGRIAILIILSLLVYPFLWVWTVLGTVWFASAKSGLPEGQKLVFLLWAFLSYCILLSIAWNSIGKVLIDMIRVPGWWRSEAAAFEMRRIDQETSVRPEIYLSINQRKTVEALIQKIPKFKLEVVPTDCNECPICLEDFCLNIEIRGLPCAHSFHMECIDKWLQLNLRCPQCRGLVFPNIDLSNASDHQTSAGLQSASVVAINHYVPALPFSPRLHGLPNPDSRENRVADTDTVTVVEAAANGESRTDQGLACTSI